MITNIILIDYNIIKYFIHYLKTVKKIGLIDFKYFN